MNSVEALGLTQIGYVGSAGRPGAGLRARGHQSAEASDALWWHGERQQCELALRLSGVRLLPVSNTGALLICGYAVPSNREKLCPDQKLAEMVWQGYERLGRPPVEELEGCYTILILDKQRECVQAYRNLCSNHNLYYTEWNGCLWFASNAALLMDACPRPAVPNEGMLPAFFLFRSVPGRETLFEGVCRLMPGELLSYGKHGLSLTRLQTLGDLREDARVTPEIVDRFEETMTRVMRNIAELDAQAANLLSGGVDSSLLQVYWNKAIEGMSVQPTSVEIVVAHPRTQGDHDYARSAVELFGTRHHTVRAGDSYAESLEEQIRFTGEPPNHVQTAYVRELARSMLLLRVIAGICGEGADSLFGTDSGRMLARAEGLQKLSGLAMLRAPLAATARLLGSADWRDVFWLIGRTRECANPRHPVNRIAVFADLPSVNGCFSMDKVAQALAARRQLAADGISCDTVKLVDATGLLGEAVPTAALWTALFESVGMHLYCPYLDSRIVRIAVNLDGSFRYRDGQTKWVLKKALARHVPEQFVRRPKRGFGQPIFEWLSPGGQLRARAEQIADYQFVPRRVREQDLAKPSWFLYSLLCYDIWHKTFVG